MIDVGLLSKYGGKLNKEVNGNLRFVKDEQGNKVVDRTNFGAGNVIVAERKVAEASNFNRLQTIESFKVLSFPDRNSWHAFRAASKFDGTSLAHFEND